MKYKANVIQDNGREWVEGYSYRPSLSGISNNRFVPFHPKYGEEWAFKEAVKQVKDATCAILEGEDEEINLEVTVEREDMLKEDLESSDDSYEFI